MKRATSLITGRILIALGIIGCLLSARTVSGTPPPVTPTVKIEKTHFTMQGRNEEVSITVENGPFDMGGFDFLIAYDNSALYFVGAELGQLLIDCGWEYFTYRYGDMGNCGAGCPSGYLRVIGFADLENGPLYSPSCFGPPDAGAYELVRLTFYVSQDMTLEGQYIPIKFHWQDCGDNGVSSVTGNEFYLERRIYSFTGVLLWDEDDDVLFPESSRLPGVGAPDDCLIGGAPGKPVPYRFFHFWHGGIDIIPIDSIDDRGDINLNGLAYEIGDAILFSNYMIYGPSVWHPLYYEGQIAATDINNDGNLTTVSDLVYLIRIITGDAQPIPKIAPHELIGRVDWRVDQTGLHIDFTGQADAGAMLLVFDHQNAEFGPPQLAGNVSSMKMIWFDNGEQLRILLYSMEQETVIPANAEEILTIPLLADDPRLTLSEVDAAGYYGKKMNVEFGRSGSAPQRFVLSQNSPNPFNAGTRIEFSLAEAGVAKLDVYDVLGRKITTLADQYFAAGGHHVLWDGRDQDGRAIGSGIYFYRLQNDNQQLTRKMVLLK